MVIEIARTCELTAPLSQEKLPGLIYLGEENAHKFIISATKHGIKTSLSGSVSGNFLGPSGTVGLVGSISNGDAVVTLKPECYTVPGRFKLTIFVTTATETLCVYSAVGTTDRTENGTIIDGGDIIPSVADLVAEIQAAVNTIPVPYTEMQNRVAEAEAIISNATKTTDENDAFSVVGTAGYISATNGNFISLDHKFTYTDYVNVQGFASITFKRIKLNNASILIEDGGQAPIMISYSDLGMAFYTKNKTFVGSAQERYCVIDSLAPADSYISELYTIKVPEGAAYARFTVFTDTNEYGSFSWYGTSYEIANSGTVHYNGEQDLTNAQKAQARANIGLTFTEEEDGVIVIS